MTGADAAPFAKYNADGTGRDTYIRRDPVECFGKMMYTSEPRLITRLGAAGSHVPRERGKRLGETDEVGGHLGGGGGFERPDRFLRCLRALKVRGRQVGPPFSRQSPPLSGLS